MQCLSQDIFAWLHDEVLFLPLVEEGAWGQLLLALEVIGHTQSKAQVDLAVSQY